MNEKNIISIFGCSFLLVAATLL
jgi:hypothetical protein